MHPANVLFKGKTLPRVLPVCDHYCGTEVRMQKALKLQQELGPVFDITFDCEDGAPIGEEITHAHLCSNLINSSENKFNRVGVRIHDPKHSSVISDIQVLVSSAGEKLAFITIPKVNSAKETQGIIDLINTQCQKSGIDKHIPIQVLIETHQSLHDVFAIAALPQVECLSFGLMDFVSGHHGAIPSEAMDRNQFNHPLVMRAMLEISAACHMYGKIPSHNVCTNINDPAIIKEDSLKAKNLFGYMRKWSIHPNQIPHILEVFQPSDIETEEAIEILTKAADAQWGPIQVNGKLHDRASYRYYWTLMQRVLAAGKNPQKIIDRKWA